MSILQWIIANRDGLIAGILTGIFTSVFISLVKGFIMQLLSLHSSYSGVWEQDIYPIGDDNYQKEPVKKDTYNLKHYKIKSSNRIVINIKGRIERRIPPEVDCQKVRKWKILGYLDGDVMTILYQSKEGQMSRGCIYVRQQGDFEFRGYYLAEHNSGNGAIDKTPLIIKKINAK